MIEPPPSLFFSQCDTSKSVALQKDCIMKQTGRFVDSWSCSSGFPKRDEKFSKNSLLLQMVCANSGRTTKLIFFF